MNKEIIKEETNWLLEAINEQYEAIRQHGGRIPRIEFDILMENIRKFYQDMHLLQRMNDAVLFPVHHPDGVPHPDKVQHPDGVHHPDRVTVQFSDPEPAAPVSEAPAELYPAPEPTHSSPVQFNPVGGGQGRPEPQVTLKKPVKGPEIDLFASEEPIFNIQLRNAREKSLGPKIPSERIDSLKTAIGINEKFMFINELFDGNLREYNETIETLNGFTNLDQASGFLDLMCKKNFWNTGSNAFKKLQELVERRF